MVVENEDIMIDQNKTIYDNDEKICFKCKRKIFDNEKHMTQSYVINGKRKLKPICMECYEKNKSSVVSNKIVSRNEQDEYDYDYNNGNFYFTIGCLLGMLLGPIGILISKSIFSDERGIKGSYFGFGLFIFVVILFGCFIYLMLFK